MLYRLVSHSDSQSWDLQLPAIVGRSDDSAVNIDHGSISRHHCQFTLGTDESLQVRDMGSLNGTYVNGERIRSLKTILPGDNVQIGGVAFRVEFNSDTLVNEPNAIRAYRKPSSVADTQPMSTIKTPSFTMHEVIEPTKQWWQFWKVG